mgnify:FL=1|tara:strand:- start:27 stop:1013 length:987 start_codon:yes stop_codon:yes gene_type:complete
MKKKKTKKISEKIIINEFLKRLNFNKIGTFNFENDAGFLNLSKNYKTIVTTDTITESIDFFKNDPPESVAHKLFCVNLSDLSAMGSIPIAYTLNLSISSKINYDWLKKFTNRLFILQKKYNIYLLGGDISKSRELSLSSTFFGKAKFKNILSQNNCFVGDNIWVTGNLGNSYLGYKIMTEKKLKISKKIKDFYIDKYLYPSPFMLGSTISKYANSAIDISDGFLGDLNKMLNGKFGAKIYSKKIPITNNLKQIILDNKHYISVNDIMRWGDDYQLIFTSKNENRKKIKNFGKKNNIKISNVGTVIKTKGIFNDSMNVIKNLSSFDHFC